MTSDERAEPGSWLSSWAPPNSRLGALQRGRGDGFRAALAGGSAAAAEVIGCVIADPRWDRQVETRDDYYARVLLALAADLQPIAARLAALADAEPLDSPDLWLPLGVCGELAVRGHAGAITLLADLVAYTRLWRPCLDALESVGGEDLIRAVVSPAAAAALVARATPAELDDAVALVAAPWDAWAASLPDLRAALTRRDAASSPSQPMSGPISWVAHRIHVPSPGAIDPSLSTEALLELELLPGRARELAELLDARRDAATTDALLRAATCAASPTRALALEVLGRRACVDLRGEAAAFLRAEVANDANRHANMHLRRGYIAYLAALPAAAVLPLARAWFHEPWPLSRAATAIFERHATLDDAPALEAAGADALAIGEIYRLCDILEALGTPGSSTSVALLLAVAHDVPYSYARWRALDALVPHVGHAEVDAMLTDALWDCESGARLLACEQADLDAPPVRARLAELGADDREEDEVCALARELSTES